MEKRRTPQPNIKRELTPADVIRRDSMLPQGWIEAYTYTPQITIQRAAELALHPFIQIKFTDRGPDHDALTIVINNQ